MTHEYIFKMSEEREWVLRHQRVKQELDKLISEIPCACAPVKLLAQRLDVDPRTIRAHLEVMKTDGVGDFLDPDKNIFCTRAGIKQFAQRLGLKLLEE